tara:strand:+ start:488 stop:1138 length:651 start_codon:yes stop_codon:yes gene_type:complete
MNKKILVCGRGISLSFIDNPILQQDYDYIILMNEFNLFTKQCKKVSNFLKNKPIIQFVNITELGLDKEFLSNYDIQKIYVTRLVPNGASSWWRESRKARGAERHGRVCYHPSDRLEDYMHIVENTVDVTSLYAILDLQADDITFIGVEFYENGYYLDHSEPDYLEWDQEEQQKVINRIKGSQSKIVSLFPNIKFTYITNSTFDPKLENCNIIKIGA